jgi:hypothetical protein
MDAPADTSILKSLEGLLMPPKAADLTFIEEFVVKNYSRQPTWVRTSTFLIFVFLLVYATAKSVGGQHVLSGRIVVETQDSQNRKAKKPAKSYEVLHGEMLFGTNSKGFYHVVLNPFDYARLLIDGKLALSILKEDITLDERVVRLRRLDSTFEDVVLPSPVEGREGAFLTPRAPAGLNSPLAAWAAPPPERKSRLAIYMIELARGHPDVQEVAVELQLGGQTQALLATRTGRNSGPVLVISGEPVLFGSDYYFPFPEDGSAPQVSVRISARTGVFSSYAESFSVPARIAPGLMVTLAGQRGSRMQVLLAFPYDVTVFDKGDIAGRKESLAEALLRNGLVLRETTAPLGYRSETNAVFGGKAVPFTAIQSALRAVAEQGIGIKTVQYRLDLKSGDPNQIQIGGSRACDSRQPIPPNTLLAILNARTEQDFVQLIAPYLSCIAPPPRTRALPSAGSKR